MTADERLALIRVKVERAKKHIRDLEVEVASFLALKPYIVAVEPDHETGQTIVYYLLKVTETPAIIPAITGDVLFNLRAALDHLAYHLARINTADERVLKATYFPISDSATKYKTDAPGKVKGMRQSAIKAINETEPYKGGNGHVLWQLHRLNIRDKHRILITVGCELSGVRLHPTRRRQMHKAIHASVGISLTDAEADVLNPFKRPVGQSSPLKEGDELVRDPFANEEVDQNTQFTFDIALNEPPIIECEPLLPTLVGMADRVDDLITNFKPLLA
jgi:hypothetical protein